MNLTLAQKKIIAEYCGWDLKSNRKVSDIPFDLNDAGKVVKVMVKKGDWEDFYLFFVCLKTDHMKNRIKG